MKKIITGILCVIVFILAMKSWFIVNPGEEAIIVSFGQVKDNSYKEGFHGKMFYDSKIKMSVRTQKEEVDAKGASKDLQNVDIKIAINYNIRLGEIKNIYKTFGGYNELVQNILRPAIQEAVKATTAKYTAEELITKRNLVSSDIKIILSEKTINKGLIITEINITNFAFSEAFDKAIESKVQAEQDALTEKNKLEKVKFIAQQNIENAKAEAEKIRIQAEAITKQGGKEYVQMKWIEKWNGALPTYMTSGNESMMMNIK